MRIQHNIPAMNAYRNYNTNTKALQGNLQKLSSGYKINKAGDDAAGLAISEKMRAQITGLEVAQKNAKDGISLVQTAEGAMTEIHTMLNRMFSLAEQSANGTYDNEVDRKQLNEEFTRLTEEIDRIADSTNFNGKKLLNGKIGQEDANGGGGDTAAIEVVATTDFTDTTTANPAKLTDVALSFDAGATEDEKAALNTALKDVTAGIDITVDAYAGGNAATAGEIGNNATIKFDNLPTGYELRIAAQDSTVLDSTTNSTFKFGAAGNTSNNDKIEPGANVSFEVWTTGAGAKKVGTLDVGLTTTGLNTTGTGLKTTVKFDDEPTMIKNADIDTANAAKDLKTDYGIDKIDFGETEVAAGKDVTVELDGTNHKLIVKVGNDTFESAAIAAGDITGTGDELTLTKTGGTDTITVKLTDGQTKISDTAAAIGPDKVGETKAAPGKSTDGLRLRVGDSVEDYDNIYVDVKSMKSGDLTATVKKEDGSGVKDSTGAEVKSITLDKLSVLKAEDADVAMVAIKDIINQVSTERGKLGATQNRLDHTINNLSTMQENIQDAEATIRDVDVAEEMMKYTKNNILVQSAQAMLAQANQLPQGVLQLLG